MNDLIKQILNCEICKTSLPNHPKPILQANIKSKILIIGQAPGQKVQQSGVPWDDQSGDELRRWLGIGKEHFYDSRLVALMPMGFCYPGKSQSGDLPPRPECAPTWHQLLLAEMKEVQITLLIGQYSQKYYLRDKLKPTLTETVKNFREFLPRFFPLVHPSPRNRIWQKKNPWFESDVVPHLQNGVRDFIRLT
jgi:uracil-DNA glycosylase